MYSIGDASKNVGVFVSSILNQPELTQGGKFVFASVEETTIGEMLDTWTEATGKPSVYVQTTSLEAFDAVWPMWGREMGLMMLLWEELGDKSWSGEKVILTKEDLKIKDKLVTTKEAFQTLDWSSL